MLNKIKDIFKILFLLLFIIVFMIFVFSNTEMVKINLFPFYTMMEIRLFLLIIFSFSLGFLFALLLNFSKNIINGFKSNKKISDLEKEIKILKNEQKRNANDKKN